MKWLRGRASRKSGRFKLSGGRAGTIQYDSDGRRAEVSWEMLVGGFDMVVYAGDSRWVLPEERPMAEDELRELTRELTREMKINIELSFSHGTELFRWRDAV